MTVGTPHEDPCRREKRSSCVPAAVRSSQLRYTASPEDDRNGSPLPEPAGDLSSWLVRMTECSSVVQPPKNAINTTIYAHLLRSVLSTFPGIISTLFSLAKILPFSSLDCVLGMSGRLPMAVNERGHHVPFVTPLDRQESRRVMRRVFGELETFQYLFFGRPK